MAMHFRLMVAAPSRGIIMKTQRSFFGWRVAWAAFIVAIFGWGVEFYGPPVFLHAVIEQSDWSRTL